MSYRINSENMPAIIRKRLWYNIDAKCRLQNTHKHTQATISTWYKNGNRFIATDTDVSKLQCRYWHTALEQWH